MRRRREPHRTGARARVGGAIAIALLTAGLAFVTDGVAGARPGTRLPAVGADDATALAGARLGGGPIIRARAGDGAAALVGLQPGGRPTANIDATALRGAGVTLAPCPDVSPRAQCGHVSRAWDPTGAVSGSLPISFALVPARDGRRPVLGTIVAQEGGPGYSSVASAPWYLDLFGPLLDRRNLLLIDQRGTGRSQAIDCPMLQELRGRYAPAAAACADLLAPRAHLYGTDLAADDLAAVVTALGVGPIDLYGDSYGTFFAQVFAGRHGDLLRTLTLDGAYPTYGEDAWYDTQAPALRRSLAVVCRASAWCRDAGGSATDRFDAVLARLRPAPVRGTAPGADRRLHTVRLDPSTLAYVAYNATYVPTTYRELDAAERAALDGDWTPLLRLVAEASFPGGGVDPPNAYSEGHDAAVTCRDYPQLYDLTAAPAVRRAQLATAVHVEERTNPLVYAPFTVGEYLAAGWGTQDWCTDWPAPPAGYEPAPPRPPSGEYPDVPTLVLSGELDTITTPAEGSVVAARLPNATWVPVTAGLHVTALGDVDGCASQLVVDFINLGAVGDASCAAGLAPLRTAPPFWATSEMAAPPSDGTPSAAWSPPERVAATAVATAGDAIARWWQTYETGGLGLRGGAWTARGDLQPRITLTDYRFATDVAVSGTITWDRVRGTVTGELTVAGPDGASGRLAVHWDTRRPGAMASATGTLGADAVHLFMLAP